MERVHKKRRGGSVCVSQTGMFERVGLDSSFSISSGCRRTGFEDKAWWNPPGWESSNPKPEVRWLRIRFQDQSTAEDLDRLRCDGHRPPNRKLQKKDLKREKRRREEEKQ